MNLPWTACGFVCNVSISLIQFPSPNIISWLKLEQWQHLLSDSYDWISLKKKLSWFVMSSWFLGVRARYKKYLCKGKSNETTWEHHFLVPDIPLHLPSNGCMFFFGGDRKLMIDVVHEQLISTNYKQSIITISWWNCCWRLDCKLLYWSEQLNCRRVSHESWC